MAKRKTPGLVKRGNIWHIKKRIRGYGRLNETTGTADLAEAERYLAFRQEEIRKATVYGERPKVLFKEAAAKYLQENGHLRSLERAGYAFDAVMPFIGELELGRVHDGTLKPYVDHERSRGLKAATINRNLDPVRRVLTLAARKWRHPSGMTYLQVEPMIDRVPETDTREPYPLSWDEQRTLLAELPAHLQRMVLFDVNTGLRVQELTNLRWTWELSVPELDSRVFVLPAKYAKNGEERVILLNDTARRVVDELRGQHKEFVFTFRGHQLTRVLNSSWKKARVRAGLPQLRVHDLRHTFSHRLRAAGVSLEDRKALLGHTNDDVTTHYSAADLNHLLECVRKIERQDRGTVLRVVGAKREQTVGEAQSSPIVASVSG